jgi:hypothetical protein
MRNAQHTSSLSFAGELSRRAACFFEAGSPATSGRKLHGLTDPAHAKDPLNGRIARVATHIGWLASPLIRNESKRVERGAVAFIEDSTLFFSPHLHFCMKKHASSTSKEAEKTGPPLSRVRAQCCSFKQPSVFARQRQRRDTHRPTAGTF